MGNGLECFTIDGAFITKLKSEGLTVEEYYILFSKMYKKKWTSIVKPSVFSYNNLIVKKLLTSNRKISAKGIAALTFVIEQDIEVESNKKGLLAVSIRVKDVWEAYPTTDKCKSFTKTRALRTNRGECYIEIQKILNGKVYNADDIIRAINNEVENRHRLSVTSNHMTYMKNMLRWLRNEDYLVWIDDLKTQEGDISTASVTGGLE